MTTIAFDAGSWLNAADQTREVSTTLKSVFDNAISDTLIDGEPDNRRFWSPVDVAIVIGLKKRNADFRQVNEAIQKRLASEAAKMTDTGDDDFATEEEGSEEARRIW